MHKKYSENKKVSVILPFAISIVVNYAKNILQKQTALRYAL